MRLQSRFVVLSTLLAAAGGCGTDLDLGPPPAAEPPNAPATPPRTPPLPQGKPGAPSFEDQAKALGEQWSWLTPQPTGEVMRAAAGTRLSDLWFVGDGGTVLHSDGHAFSTLRTVDEVSLDVAWAPAANVLWTAGLDMGGHGHLFRIHGASVVEDAAFGGFALQTLAGLDESHAFAASETGEVRAWNGATWTTLRPATNHGTRGLHAFSASDVWAVGDGGKIDHFNGTAFTAGAWDGVGENPFDASLQYDGVWGAAPNDVWAVATTSITAAVEGGDVSQSAPVFSHFDGTSWRVVQRATNSCGAVQPYNGNSATWQDRYRDALGRPASRRPYGRTLAGVDATHVLFSTYAICPWRWDGQAWSAETFGKGGIGPWDGIAGASALGDGTLLAGFYRWNPGAPFPTMNDLQTSARFRPLMPVVGDFLSPALDESGALWVRDGSPAMWNGRELVRFDHPSEFFCSTGAQPGRQNVFARGANDIWISSCWHRGTLPSVGGVGHFDGQTWTILDDPAWVSWANGIVVTGNASFLWRLARREYSQPLRLQRYHRDGTLDSSVDLEPGESLSLAVTPASPSRIFAAYRRNLDPGAPSEVFARYVVTVDSWDVGGTPKRELEFVQTSPWPGSAATFPRKVDWTNDGRLLVLRGTGILVRQHDGTVTTAIDRAELDFQDVASAGGSRFWVLASGAIYLWDSDTNAFALVRHRSDLSSLLTAPNGEAWAVGHGILHFAEAAPKTK